jgi:uncharacterized protein (TIGR03086 family)
VRSRSPPTADDPAVGNGSEETGQQATGLASYHRSMNTTAPVALVDPRPTLARSVALAGVTVAAVRPEQMANPTPCGTFDVRQLLGHLLGVLDRIAVVGRNKENPFARPEDFEPTDGDWVGAWNQFARAAEAAWVDPSALTRPTMLPWAAESGALALRTYVAELTTHTWDLARATGQQPEWDDDVLAMSLAVMREILPAAGRSEMFDAIRATMPQEMRGRPDPYQPAVPLDADAALIDQLVAHVGRDPS